MRKKRVYHYKQPKAWGFSTKEEKYILWGGNNQEEIIKFLYPRIRVIYFKPYLMFNGFRIKKGVWLCLNKYGGLDFLNANNVIEKLINEVEGNSSQL